MNESLLHVPAFPRLDDYLGAWACEATRFAAIWEYASRLNLKAHVAEGAEPLRAGPEKLPVPNGKSIAVVRLTGLLMKSQTSLGGTSTIQARRDIRQAASDPDIGAILLLADTPGGTVSGTDDLAADVRAARKSKPVWAHVDDLTASAGYWAVSQADKITANSPTALVGSIGTLQVIRDFSAAAEREGVRTLVFSTGPLKGLGTAGAPVTDEQAAHVQALVNETQKSFDAAVMRGRSLSAKELAAVRHGGVMPATEALDKRLIDAIQPLEKTIAEIKRLQAGDGGRRVNADAGRPVVAGSFPMLRRGGLPMLQSRTGERDV